MGLGCEKHSLDPLSFLRRHVKLFPSRRRNFSLAKERFLRRVEFVDSMPKNKNYLYSVGQ